MLLWGYIRRGWAERVWERWYQWAIRSRLEPIKRVARMIKRHCEPPRESRTPCERADTCPHVRPGSRAVALSGKVLGGLVADHHIVEPLEPTP